MTDKGINITVEKSEFVDVYVEDGILYMYYHSIDLVDLNVAKSIVQARLTFTNGVAYPCLFDITKVKETTKDARDYFANEGNELVLASAVLVNSPVLRMLVNFYITVNKPKNPTRMFTNKDNALEWLTQFKR